MSSKTMFGLATMFAAIGFESGFRSNSKERTFDAIKNRPTDLQQKQIEEKLNKHHGLTKFDYGPNSIFSIDDKPFTIWAISQRVADKKALKRFRNRKKSA